MLGVLDITLRKDENVVRNEKAPRVGLKAKRLRAGWDQPYLLMVLCAN
jgi:hypothetical protein